MPTLLITGASGGLGFEFCRQYALDGWRVIATSRAPAQRLRELGPEVTTHSLDAANPAQLAALSRTLAAESIDLLIANAAVKGPRVTHSGPFDTQAWLKAFEINAIAPFALASAFRAQVARSKERKMIAITSHLSSIGANDSGGIYGYRSSKAALNAIWRSIAMDHRDLVAVLLHPGWVRTNMGGPTAPLSPEESVGCLRRVIAKLGPSESGRFYGYDGRPIAW